MTAHAPASPKCSIFARRPKNSATPREAVGCARILRALLPGHSPDFRKTIGIPKPAEIYRDGEGFAQMRVRMARVVRKTKIVP